METAKAFRMDMREYTKKSKNCWLPKVPTLFDSIMAYSI